MSSTPLANESRGIRKTSKDGGDSFSPRKSFRVTDEIEASIRSMAAMCMHAEDTLLPLTSCPPECNYRDSHSLYRRQPCPNGNTSLAVLIFPRVDACHYTAEDEGDEHEYGEKSPIWSLDELNSC